MTDPARPAALVPDPAVADDGIRLRPFRPADTAAVVRLAGLCLGQGYITDLAPILARPGLVFVVAEAAGGKDGDGGVAGFVFGWRLEPSDLAALYPELKAAQVAHLVGSVGETAQLGILKTIAVDPGCQGRGLGARLMAACLDRLAADGATALVVPAWIIDGRVNLGPLLDRAGLPPIAALTRPWQADCDSGAMVCPARTDRCRCDLRFHAGPLRR
ncbi:MAG: hypothetical protein RLY86_2779 [Pseudomonadota bacterium]|jgi:ribosomal protein S18 acetylase RimI-like enzyme